jgi:hypothetical protein
MTNINALPEKSEVLTTQDGGTYSEHCDEHMDPIRIYAFMMSGSVCCCTQSTTFNIYPKNNLKHKYLSKF